MPPETKLTGPQRRARRAFCARRRATALATADELEAAGLPADELEALAESAPKKPALVASWDDPDRGVVWTLTPLGASRMGLEIVERAEGQAVWERIETDPKRRRKKRPVRLYGQAGARGLGRIERVRDEDAPNGPEPASRELDPAAAAQAAECEGLLRESEAIVKSEPDRARELLLRAESIVPGVADELGERYLLDEEGARPLRIMGRLVPRDPRMGPSKAG